MDYETSFIVSDDDVMSLANGVWKSAVQRISLGDSFCTFSEMSVISSFSYTFLFNWTILTPYVTSVEHKVTGADKQIRNLHLSPAHSFVYIKEPR